MFKLVKKIMGYLWTWLVKYKAKSYGENLRVNGKSIINRNTFLGENVNFNGMKIKGRGKVVIGDNFHSGQECLMLTDNHNYDGGNAIPYDSTVISKEIIIENNVWLGDRVIVLGGSHISEGAIIQAGSVVSGFVPKCAVAGGHPAKVFKYRDIEHYERLKESKCFF